MAYIILLIVFVCGKAYAINLKEAITSTEKPPEILVQEYTHKSNKIIAFESAQGIVPNVYLYYNYSKPGKPRFDGGASSSNDTFGRFITGVRQESYGVAAEYNIFAIPQLFVKMYSANNSIKSSFFRTQNKKSEHYYNMAVAYIGLYRAQNLVKLQKKVYETAKSRYEEMNKYFLYGRIAKKDVLSAESEYLMSQTVLDKIQNQLKTAQQKYIDKFSILHSNLEIPTVSLSQVAKNLEDLKNIIERRNKDLQSLKYAANGYKSESYISAINMLPAVTVGYREAYTVLDPLLAQPNYQQGTFYVNARMDLLNMTKYLSTFRYNAEKNKKIAELKIAKMNYTVEAENLWNDTLNQEKTISVLERVVSNYKEIYKITQKEVRYGAKSFTDELEAKKNYTQSQIDLLEAKLKKAENIYKLQHLAGTLQV